MSKSVCGPECVCLGVSSCMRVSVHVCECVFSSLQEGKNINANSSFFSGVTRNVVATFIIFDGLNIICRLSQKAF